MAKAESLSSDLELVKEIEQLKLKQKLLLQALKNKDKQAKKDKVITEISNQITFLVEIFKESNLNDEKKEKADSENDQESETQEDAILKRIATLETMMIEHFEKLNEKIAKISETKTETVPEISLAPKEENPSKSSPQEPPKPRFEVESKVDDLSKEKPKKKGLFSL